MTTWRLTHCGHRLARLSRAEVDPWLDATADERLREVLRHTVVGSEPDPVWERLEGEGWVAAAPDGVDPTEVELAYARNPLEHVRGIALEYTHRCEGRCLHCRSAHFPRLTERDPTALARAAARLLPMGIRCFHLVGGEVIRFGDGWLEVTRRLQSLTPCQVQVITSGWWLGRQDFEAAGRRYADEGELLADLVRCGVTQVSFSVDGDERRHDLNRRAPGLYRRIAEGVDRVRLAGLAVRFSLVVPGGGFDADRAAALAGLVRRAYDLPPTWSDADCVELVLNDPDTTASNLVDIGRSYGRSQPAVDLVRTPSHLLTCKAFYRPYPQLRIQPDGGVSTCPLLPPGEGFGDIHTDDVRTLVNHLDQWHAFRLHALQRVGEVLPHVDHELLWWPPAHLCTLRVVATLLARRLGEEPRRNDPALVRRANLEVARLVGALPPDPTDR